MSLKSFARRSPAAWFAALVIAGACTAGVDKLTGPIMTPDDAARSSIPTTPGIVISQVYGAGGNGSAKYTNDYVELFNPGDSPVAIDGWSLQYASSTGSSWTNKTNLSGTIQPKHYFLVQEASGGTNGVALPVAPDLSGSINMAAGAGKIVLVSNTTTLTGVCPVGGAIVDFVGFGSGTNCFEGATGPTGTISIVNAAFRKDGGNVDANDNANDFTVATALPRNSGNSNGTVTAVPLEKVTITGGSETIVAGATTQFTAVGQNDAGAAASNVTVTWSSDNAAVATVDNTGKVTGVVANATPVTLTATATTGAGATLVTKTATVQITVTAPIAPTPIVISQVYGGGGNVGATLTNDFIELFNPTAQPVDLAGWSVQYGSASTGTWTATPLTGTIQPGGYFLIQESKGSGGTEALPTPDLIGTLTIGGGAGKVALVRSTAVLPTGCPAASAPVQDIVAWASTCFEGSAAVGAPTSAQSVLRNGEGSIDTDDNAADFDIDLAAPRNSATDRIPVAGALDHVVIGGGAASVAAGASTQFTTSSLDAAGVIVGTAKVTWSSSDASIASVDNTGKVTGKIVSATPVTLTASSTAAGVTKTATTTITVTVAAPVASVTLAPDSWTLNTATTKALIATALDAGGQPTAGSFTWQSSDPTVATVDANGVVTGVKAGTSTITVTADGKTATAAITVIAGTSTVTVTNGKTSLALGMQTQFFFGGAPSVVWSTTNSSIITVDQRGVMTAKGVGSAQLIATSTVAGGGATQVAIKTYLAAGTTGVRLGHNEEFGIPQAPIDSNHFIIRRQQYTVSYNASQGGANWVSWNLDKTHVGTNGRCPGTCYSADTALTNAGITAYTTADWVSGNTYDRGHMTPSADWTSSEADNNTTFFLTNFVPQTHDMNAGPWERLETALRDSVSGGREAYIIAGGTFKDGVGLGTISDLGKIRIPNSTWKIAVITPAGTGLNADGTLPANSTVMAVDMPNTTGISGDPFQKYLTTVDAIQQATGLDFLAMLRDDIECRVEVRNCAPMNAAIAGPVTGLEGQTLSFTGSATDPDAGDVVSYSWSIDGQNAGTGASLSHTFANDGSYVIRLVASDSKGGQTSTEITVNVANVAPIVSAPAAATIAEGSHYTATATFADPGADAWTATVNYGDGSPAQTVAVSGNTVALDHLYAVDGTFTITIGVADESSTGQASATVVVTNVAPAIAPLANATIMRGESYSAAGSFTDPGADSWTATVSYGDTPASALALDGKSFTLAHSWSTTGVKTVTVSVNDGLATGSATAQVTVLTGTQSITDLAGQVSALAAAGRAGTTESKWLLNKLDVAGKLLEKGNTGAAANQLEEIIRYIDAAHARSALNATDAASLTAYAQRIIAAM